ncbi:ATP-binding protein [Dactylosporangium sp. CS-033363]|uniref:ATP-binding protein n=1 Tax=Dactylosporangium sp. CS-033363 TaxID=3239935 RepID=UPI003D91AF68
MTEYQPRQLSAREIAAEYETGTPFDLSACVTEQIHLLGRVQSHGALVAVDEETLRAVVVSDNAAAVLGTEPHQLVELLGAEQADLVRQSAATASAFLEVEVGERAFDLSLHRGDGLLVCEFEPAGRKRAQFTRLYSLFRAATQELGDKATVEDLCQAAVHEIRRLTGYARVVAYRFDGDGPGQVIAEEADADREPWLGLWFPATDVPPQARRLYTRNWIRVIADVDDPGAGLVPPLRPGTDRPLDLSGSALRTVSPFHIEYLRNIGVAASMSVSLIHEGRLWGLIACHGRRPTVLGPEQRAACEMFGIALSLQLAALEQQQLASAEAKARRAMVALLVDAADTLPGGLVQGQPNLLDLIPADGVLVRAGGETVTAGRVPDAEALLEVVAGRGEVGRAWSTDRLGEVDPRAEALSETASGILVLRLSSTDVVVWCRGEASRDVRWATDPGRPVVSSRYGHRLTPRGSSAVWRETVRGRSTRWSRVEQTIAADLWHAIAGVVLRRAEELEAFAHVVSHDLKEPLRGIAHAAAFITEDAEDLDPTTMARLDTIGRLAVRMDDLLNAVMRYAMLGRGETPAGEVELDTVLDEVLESLAPAIAERGATVHRDTTLPLVRGDRIRLYEVLQNLVSNAVKYAAAERAPAVHIGARGAAVYVRDNGIGIAPDRHEEVFRIFRRLSGGEGAGVGLTIARRIVERHGGRMWLESTPGEGSTFWFTV